MTSIGNYFLKTYRPEFLASLVPLLPDEDAAALAEGDRRNREFVMISCEVEHFVSRRQDELVKLANDDQGAGLIASLRSVAARSLHRSKAKGLDFWATRNAMCRALARALRDSISTHEFFRAVRVMTSEERAAEIAKLDERIAAKRAARRARRQARRASPPMAQRGANA